MSNNKLIDFDKTTREVIFDVYQKDLPISGGWGFTKEDAVIINRYDSTVNQILPFDGIGLELWFARHRAYIQLITQRDTNDRYSGIELNNKRQELITDNTGTYDKVIYDVSAFKDADFDELKEEWESNNYDGSFDIEAHNKKRQSLLVHFEMEYWFEISSFFGQDIYLPDTVEKQQAKLNALNMELTDDEKRDYIKDDPLITEFFVSDEMIKDFDQEGSYGRRTANGKWTAILEKTSPTEWLYIVRLGMEGIYVGEDKVPAFELTSRNILEFHKGVVMMSTMLEDYLITGEIDTEGYAFEALRQRLQLKER